MVAYGDHRNGADRWRNAGVEHEVEVAAEEFGLGGFLVGHSGDAVEADVDEQEPGSQVSCAEVLPLALDEPYRTCLCMT